ncbi:response regulator transcription factor [Paenibacillus sp. Marseille-P2973]|uniref:response regulator transcription factor n=1 Tax=unclassified Paenibacillus TaxID=185978 RepID=UPI001B36B737|nr:response regulator transcription factor [Paenibacillus sp. Marseille-P2973]MBQ4900991.1 response regulator transcription factor [Paenibacillus sp. Marseille-P2973]
MKLKVLIVDDEWNMRNLLRIYLLKEGFEAKEASNGHEALAWIDREEFDIVLLDVMMPDMDGWQVCQGIRARSQVPVLMLTARSETKDKVRGLGLGADDYLTKPFEPEELIARIYSLIRRSVVNKQAVQPEFKLRFTDLLILPEGRQVYVKDRPVDFTPKEFDLLVALAESGKRAFPREELVERVWGNDYFGDPRVVDTHVKNIREKTSKAGLEYNPIQTIWGIGYKFFDGDTGP